MRDRGLLTRDELAEQLDVHAQTINTWRRRGLLSAVPFSDKPEFLYPMPDTPPVKYVHKFTHGSSS